jgi:hypothetical protein
VGAREPPGEPSEQECDPYLHSREQEGVVISPRVARRGDVAAHVETVGQATADELGDERQEPEREP